MPEYTSWTEVPDNLRTKTQLANLDMPRKAAGPVRAYITSRRPTGRRATYELFDLTESVPSTTSAARLNTPPPCAQCGAQPDVSPSTDEHGQDPRSLCPTCRQITRIQGYQRDLAERRPALRQWAADQLANPATTVIAVTKHLRPDTPSGRRNRLPIALTIQLVDTAGTLLAAPVTYALAGPRTKGMPRGAAPLADSVSDLSTVLRGRTLLGWRNLAGHPLWYAIRELPHYKDPDFQALYQCLNECRGMAREVTAWRAHVNWDLSLRPAVDPGRADLYALLLRRMAQDPNA